MSWCVASRAIDSTHGTLSSVHFIQVLFEENKEEKIEACSLSVGISLHEYLLKEHEYYRELQSIHIKHWIALTYHENVSANDWTLDYVLFIIALSKKICIFFYSTIIDRLIKNASTSIPVSAAVGSGHRRFLDCFQWLWVCCRCVRTRFCQGQE